MAWWIYKCNSQGHSYQNAYGDWRDFFDVRAIGGRKARWGLPSVTPDLTNLQKGDMVLAYQTDRNELVGLVRCVKAVAGGVYFVPVEEIGVKVRPLKKADQAIAAIPALKPGPIQTLYSISKEDARRLLDAARAKETDLA
jgi:hypothetical protein